MSANGDPRDYGSSTLTTSSGKSVSASFCFRRFILSSGIAILKVVINDIGNEGFELASSLKKRGGRLIYT